MVLFQTMLFVREYTMHVGCGRLIGHPSAPVEVCPFIFLKILCILDDRIMATLTTHDFKSAQMELLIS